MSKDNTLMAAAIAALVTACPAIAGPFLVSDPWPADVQQPDSCRAIDDAANMIPLTLISASGARSIRHDMAGTAAGQHAWAVTCQNAWGASHTVNFTFAAGAPSAPAGLDLAQ